MKLRPCLLLLLITGLAQAAEPGIRLDAPLGGWRPGNGEGANFRQTVNYPAASVNTPADQAMTARIKGEIEPVDLLVGQAHVVARIGQREHAHHQRGIADAAGHRAGDAAVRGGSIGTRPSEGFSVKMPHQLAGRRTEPPMSVPMCSGPYPAAAAAPAPALEPPGFLERSQGLRVRAWKLDSPEDSMP